MARYFTLEEARGMLAFAGRAIREAVHSKNLAEQAETWLRDLSQKILFAGGMTVDTTAVEAWKTQYDTSSQSLKSALESLEEAGIQVKDLDIGLIDFPTELSPLARQKRDDPSLVDRFELFVARMEMANAYSELNDPQEQRRRFEQQLEARARGDDEAQPLDEDYIRALEYGLPPTAGEGVGIDRLAMLFADRASIRDLILFPLLRPETFGEDED